MSKENSLTKTLLHFALSLIIIIAMTIILLYTKSMMIPFILSLFTYFVILSPVRFLEYRAKIPHFIAVGLVLGILCIVLALMALLITGSVSSALKNIELYKERLLILTEVVINQLVVLGIEPNMLDREHLLKGLDSLPFFSYLSNVTGKMLSIATDFMLMGIFLLFLLISKPSDWRKEPLFREIDNKIRIYLYTKIFASIITGALTALALSIIGLDLAIMFGFLAFLLNFIPNVGGVITLLLPMPIAFVQFSSPIIISLCLVIPAIIQFLVGNIIETKILGDNLDLHPITLLLSLMFWGLVWGVAGMILAAPITVIIKVCLEKIPQARWFTELMAGRVFSNLA